MKNDTSWIKSRRLLLEELKLQVAHRLGPPTPEIRRYTIEYERELETKNWKPSSKAELLKAVTSADIVYASDFHAFAQSQRMHLRILRSADSKRPIILCCEFLEARFQKQVDLFLAGQLTEKQFCQKAQWQRWGFPWENYGPLLDLARSRHWHVFGLSQGGRDHTLKDRDRFAAKTIQQIRKANPDAILYVIFGELHVAERHLPAQVRRLMSSQKEIFILQDVEKIYFRLAKKNLEIHVDVLNAGQGRFCVVEAPPWVRWQSYEMYLEKTYDRDLSDGDEPLEFGDHTKKIIDLLNHDFNISTRTRNIAVYSSRDATVWSMLRENLTTSELRMAKQLMARDRSFYIPQGQIFYLSRESMNHAADLAGEYLQAQLSGRTRCLWSMPQDFLATIWVRAVGFYASKLINHKRASESLSDLRLQLSDQKIGEQRREILALALQQRLREQILRKGGKPGRQRIRPRLKVSYLEAARLLGSMLGEKLYQAQRRHSISTKTVLGWISQDVLAPDFAQFYLKVSHRLDVAASDGKSRSERL